MTPDPVAHGVELLARGHRLYGAPDRHPGPGTTPETLRDHAGRLNRVLGRDPGAAVAPTTARLVAALRHTGELDARLRALLTGARGAHELGRHATGTVLADALADPHPAADTPMGRREALRRTASRIRTQHRHISRSRRHCRRLARRMRRLAYPQGAHAIAVRDVRYARAIPPGRVRDRINRALDHLGITDPVARRNWRRGYETLIARESGGRAAAIASEPATAAGWVNVG